MAQHGLRDMVSNLAPINWALAADYSKQIDEPLYACQAFAWCARFAPQPDADRLVDKAFEWAERAADGFMRVAASAWPLRALIELGDEARAEREFDRIAPLAALVSPPSSRAEACLLVYEAAAIAQKAFALKALHWLLAECQPVEFWRARRAIREAMIITVSLHLTDQKEVLPLVQDERLRNNIALRLNQGEHIQPRPFFWPLR